MKLAKKFYDLAKNDSRFEVVGKPMMGLVCFRLKVRKLVIRFICSVFKAKLRLLEFALVLSSVNYQTPLYHFSGTNSEQQEREKRTCLPGHVVHPGQSYCNYIIWMPLWWQVKGYNCNHMTKHANLIWFQSYSCINQKVFAFPWGSRIVSSVIIQLAQF